MNLIDLGYNNFLHKYRKDNNLECFEIGRVILEHKERYIVGTEKGEMEAEITGNLRYTAKSREDLPAVGDWVALKTYNENFSIIYKLYPRYSVIARQSINQFGEIQIIATNIDYAFLVQAVDRDFNINRLERYLTICNSSKISPIIVLTKTDLIDAIALCEIKKSINQRIKNVRIISVCNSTQEGYKELRMLLEKGKTYCMLGSSGVGKSTLTNILSGRTAMKTDAISTSTNKGKHITTHRELIVLGNGAILIDNPGMREVGITDTTDGLEITFENIYKFAKCCKYNDCTHTNESGCSVIQAVKEGNIDKLSYENYQKMIKEQNFFESSLIERRKKDKDFGKMCKNYFKKNLENEKL